MSRFADLGEQIAAALDVDDAILDGEIIAADETGRPQFYVLLRHARVPAYVAFDLLWLDGADLRPLPLTERRRHLQNILPKGSAIICEALSVIGTGHKLFELMCVNDLEGVMAKRLKDPYSNRKTPSPGVMTQNAKWQLPSKLMMLCSSFPSIPVVPFNHKPPRTPRIVRGESCGAD